MGPIFGQIGQFFWDIFGHCGHVFRLFSKIPTPVGSLKCEDSKNVQFFVSMSFLRVVNWLRSQNGTNFWPNRTIFLGYFWSLWPHSLFFMCFLDISS